MSSHQFNTLIANKVTDFYSGEPDFLLLSKYKKLLKDHSYFDFVTESNNAGFFYHRSLHLYSYSHNRDFNDIEYFNTLLQNTYGEMFAGLISFGQDLFGNQFCFAIENSTIIFFNSETGKREVIATHFDNWLEVLYHHFDYYIGSTLLNEWCAKNELAFNQRLYPKIPFVGGGEFRVGNLLLGTFPHFIAQYFKIASQVFHLPEGASVKIQVLKNE